MTNGKNPTPAAPSTEVASGDLPTRFEAWWADYPHNGRVLANYGQKKQIAFDAFEAALSPASDVPPPIASSGEAIPAGMKEWHGGPKPSDWSGEAVKFRNGKVMQAPVGAVWKLGWDHCYGGGDIIAYTPKTPPAASSGQDLREALAEARRRYPDDHGLMWFAAASGMMAGEITTDVEEWAAAALVPAPAVQPGGDLVEAFNACNIPPAGWWCSRAAGHEGPCAARPEPVNANKAGGLWYRRWHAAMLEINRLNEAAATPLPEAGEKA